MNTVITNIWVFVTVQIVAFDTGSATRATATITQRGSMVSIRTTPTDATTTISSPQTDEITDIFTIGGFTGSIKSFSLTYRGQGMIVGGIHQIFFLSFLFVLRNLYHRLSFCDGALHS